jgi:predicted nuclease with TOPRIM domain
VCSVEALVLWHNVICQCAALCVFIAAKTRIGAMADEVLDFLRLNFARLNERIDRIEADMAEFRERLGHIEGQVAGIYGMYATLSSRMDRMDRRLERIERRLDLVEV